MVATAGRQILSWDTKTSRLVKGSPHTGTRSPTRSSSSIAALASELGARTVAFSSGATIYVPKQVRIAVRNTGTEPVSIAFVFSKPGFEEYLRDTSVP